MMLKVELVIFLFSLSSCFGLRKIFHHLLRQASSDVGEPLFLTPYVESGKIQEGQTAAKVTLQGSTLTSYSGLFTVNKTYNSNLFFWYFPATEADPENAPVVLWLQGGPGGSSLFGLFCENGPFQLQTDGSLKPNDYSWSKPFNMIYIDNPVGAGFSFTDDIRGYATDQEDVGRELYSSLSQFFTLFPHLRKNNFYITGESYAGKYVPAISYAIYKNNKINEQKINLKGLAMGDGWSDPENMLHYGDYLYQIGLIDANGREVFREEEAKMRQLVQKEDYSGAMDLLDPLIFSGFIPYKSYFTNVTGFDGYYNYMNTGDSSQSCNKAFTSFIQLDQVRKSIHIGNLTFQNGDVTLQQLRVDIMRSVKPWLEELLENYRVLFYNGQLDIICAYPLTENVLKNLSWSGSKGYLSARRNTWYVHEDLAGFYKTFGKLTDVLVRNAGHILPQDQPVWALDLITKFVNNKFH